MIMFFFCCLFFFFRKMNYNSDGLQFIENNGSCQHSNNIPSTSYMNMMLMMLMGTSHLMYAMYDPTHESENKNPHKILRTTGQFNGGECAICYASPQVDKSFPACGHTNWFDCLVRCCNIQKVCPTYHLIFTTMMEKWGAIGSTEMEKFTNRQGEIIEYFFIDWLIVLLRTDRSWTCSEGNFLSFHYIATMSNCLLVYWHWWKRCRMLSEWLGMRALTFLYKVLEFQSYTKYFNHFFCA